MRSDPLLREYQIFEPEAVARFLKVSRETLVRLLKAYGYAYTELSPEAKPWGSGRQTWGMTRAQIILLIQGQARRHPQPSDTPKPQAPTRPGKAVTGSDGKKRVRIKPW